MIYTFIARRCADLPVATCCRVMKVSTSGFYAWRACPVSDRDWDDAVLTNTIVDIHKMSRRSYGSPRVHAELRLGLGTFCSCKRVERLMRQAGVSGIYRRRGHGCTRRDGWSRLMILSAGSSTLTVPTGSGSWTSPNIPLVKARCISRQCSMRSVAGLWAGRSRITFGPSSSSTRCRWRSGDANPPKVRRSRTAIMAPNTRLGRSAAGYVRRACSDRWAPSVTASTTASPRASSGRCSSSCSTNTAGTPRPTCRRDPRLDRVLVQPTSTSQLLRDA